MNKNKTNFIAALLIAVVSLSMGVSANFNKDGEKLTPEQRTEMREQMQAKHAAIDEAIASGYEAWANAVGESKHGEKLLEKINTDNFERFVEAHNLKKQAGELIMQSRTIMEELGFEKGQFHGKKGKRGHGFGTWKK
jgi:hypothetical protein